MNNGTAPDLLLHHENRLPAMPGTAIGVFIAEDHRITLWGLQHLIESLQPGLQLVGTATSREELLNHPDIVRADVILLDLDLNGEDSIAALPDLQRRSAGRALILTASDDTERHVRAVTLGARGVVHKSQSADTLVRAIEKVHGGEVWLERGLLGQVLGQLTGTSAPPRVVDEHTRRINSLTPRELEIVGAMARNFGAKQLAVAEELGMSENTLRNHLTTIYSKLGVRGRLELHVYATTHGLAGAEAPVVPPRP